jgi:hypothetical protein
VIVTPPSLSLNSRSLARFTLNPDPINIFRCGVREPITRLKVLSSFGSRFDRNMSGPVMMITVLVNISRARAWLVTVVRVCYGTGKARELLRGIGMGLGLRLVASSGP